MKELELIVEVHSDNDFFNATCARILLNEPLIKKILSLSKRAGKNKVIQESEYSPELGRSEIDFTDYPYRNIDDLSAMMGDDEVFTSVKDIRIDYSNLNVDNTCFWWSGKTKAEDTWETRWIPIDFIPKELHPVPKPKNQALSDEQIQKLVQELGDRSGGVPLAENGLGIPKRITREHLYQVVQYLLLKGK